MSVTEGRGIFEMHCTHLFLSSVAGNLFQRWDAPQRLKHRYGKVVNSLLQHTKGQRCRLLDPQDVLPAAP